MPHDTTLEERTVATKEEITAGIREVEERLNRLLPGIVENLDQLLPEGSWTVHDALCHMAADAHSLPRWQRQIDAATNGTSARPPGFNLDAHNQQGIDARKGKPVDEVVQEIRDGLHGDAAALPGLDDALLAREVPNFRGELQSASDRLSFTTSRHNHMHLDDIENAIKMATA
ncbi:MAG TPA: hypothetical protein VFS30_06525 [Dehalococcoidia bacterium]|nr:hypothetical protein [Dehalococcoidia bacterium]